MQSGLKSKSSAMRSTGKDLGSSANSGARTYHSDMYSTGQYLAQEFLMVYLVDQELLDKQQKVQFKMRLQQQEEKLIFIHLQE
ncbi:hypothetical protein [Klebsiella quasipneumoniae]|uniref:hypothetical protein n=1 Tax=Klebsiella quasipneumoniae TaxID=1463165 RepID=UPI00296FA11B|nr:hypothetical protein [Klebsiella quasipneumoniae]